MMRMMYRLVFFFFGGCKLGVGLVLDRQRQAFGLSYTLTQCPRVTEINHYHRLDDQPAYICTSQAIHAVERLVSLQFVSLSHTSQKATRPHAMKFIIRKPIRYSAKKSRWYT